MALGGYHTPFVSFVLGRRPNKPFDHSSFLAHMYVCEKREEKVYFLSVSAGGGFLLETKVRIVRGFHPFYVAAQLITRDSEQVNCESGLVILPEMDQAIVRHMANKIDYIYTAFPANTTIDYKWYTMRLIVRDGVVKAFVDDVQILISNSSLPTGEYREPHLAVRYETAQFECVKAYITYG